MHRSATLASIALLEHKFPALAQTLPPARRILALSPTARQGRKVSRKLASEFSESALYLAMQAGMSVALACKRPFRTSSKQAD